jgi:hypothetical protein
VLRHVPRTIALFGSPAAARVLVDSLSQVESGMVRFKLLRGLETLLREQRQRAGLRGAALAMSIDQRRIRAELDRTLARSLDLLETELLFATTQQRAARFATLGGELVVDLLRDKRELATGRLFMLLGLLHPDEDFRSIQDALRGDDDKARASAQELVETILARDVASQMLRLARGLRNGIRPRAPEEEAESQVARYETAIRSLLIDDSRSVRAVALYHAGEIGIRLDPARAAASLDDRAFEGGGDGADLRDRAMAALREVRRSGRRRPLETVPVR